MKLQIIFIAVVAAAFAFTGCKSACSDEPQNKAIKFVKVETLNSNTTQNKMTFNGKIKEKSLTSLSFRVGGPLESLNVKTGDYVKAGQVIARIDKRDYQLQLQSAKAQYIQAEAEYQRYKTLVEQKKIPENTFERVESGYLMTKTAYENALNQLNDTELKAPFAGYIFEKFVENHQTVGAGVPIVSLIDNSQLEAVVSVSESQLQRVKKDKASFLTVENAHLYDYPVALLSIGEKTQDDGLYEVKFTFENTENLNVAPGMTAEVTIHCNAQQNALEVSPLAVFHEKNSTYVWVYDPSSQKVSKRKITLSAMDTQGKVRIVSGLKNGEQVVTAGVHYLFDGQQVKPITPKTATNVGGLL